MNRRWWLLAGMLGFLWYMGSERVMAANKPEMPRWLTDFEEGRKAARASNKPLFVVFRCEH